jgi:hypothetical protein
MSHQMKWKAIVVGCFISATVELIKRRLGQFTSPVRQHRRFILWSIVVIRLFIKFRNDDLVFSEAMDNLIYNILGGLLMPE